MTLYLPVMLIGFRLSVETIGSLVVVMFIWSGLLRVAICSLSVEPIGQSFPVVQLASTEAHRLTRLRIVRRMLVWCRRTVQLPVAIPSAAVRTQSRSPPDGF